MGEILTKNSTTRRQIEEGEKKGVVKCAYQAMYYHVNRISILLNARFVTTKTQETSSITRLPNYPSLTSSHLHPTTLEAALATSAATTYFEPIHINGTYFLDGALGANNPCDVVELEASDLWCETTARLQPLIKCYISIGTGHPGYRHVSDRGIKYFFETLRKEATETVATTKNWESRWREGIEQGRCFRFNVEHGLENVGLEEHKQAGEVMSASRTYLDERGTIGMVRKCVENLRMKECTSGL